MNSTSKEYISGLSQLEMISTDDDFIGLIHVSELQNSSINYYQKLALEKAKKVGADAIYFRNFPDLTRPLSLNYTYLILQVRGKTLLRYIKMFGVVLRCVYILLSQNLKLNYSIHQNL